MLSRFRIAAVIAAVAALAVLTGGAGAATSAASANAPSAHQTAKGGASSLVAARRLALLKAADLSTRAGTDRFLRSIGLDPRWVTVQRGSHNYAGPKCPGKGWACTKARRVLQIGTANLYVCGPGKTGGTSPNSCVIVQTAAGGNSATCTELSTGPTQSCSITQSSTTGANQALVIQTLGQGGGGSGNQDATQNALVAQTSAGGANTSSVTQALAQRLGRGSDLSDEDANDSDDLTAPVSTPISQVQNAHQHAYVKQVSGTGANKSTVIQGQLQIERADHAPTITQLQNTTLQADTANCPIFSAADDPNSNQCNAVDQTSTTGTNTSQVVQSYNQFQAASNCCATTPGTQIQGVAGQGGIDHRFRQTSSGGTNTQSSNQVERQIQRRTSLGAAGINHEQHGPVRKGTGIQSGGNNDSATQKQSSTQLSTPTGGTSDTNLVTDQCTSVNGTCTGTQTVNENGQTTTQTQSGSTITLTTTCTTSCTTQPPIVFDGSPGTGAPPATLGPYTMTAFGSDPQPLNDGTVSGVSDPAGTLAFSSPLNHSTVGNGWATWSNGYTGDVYWTDTGSTIQITLPAGTRAFYLYAEPNAFDLFNVTATAQDGTTSGPVQVQGDSGAKYFGFYATGTPNIATITVTTDDTSGLGVGEFGISPAAAVIG